MLQTVIISFLAIFLYGVAPLAHAEGAGQGADEGSLTLERKVGELQQEQDEIFKQLASEKYSVRPFLGDEILIGGFLDSGITGLWGPTTHTQVSTASDFFAVNVAAHLNPAIRFNSQILFNPGFPLLNPNNNPLGSQFGLPSSRRYGTLTTITSISQAYLEYGRNPGFTFQMGRGYVPFGIAFQQRDRVLFRRRNGPQMISADTPDNVVIASPSWTGAHILGAFALGPGRWGYDLYTLTPLSDPSDLGGGTRAWFEVLPPLTLGTSLQIAKRDGTPYEAIGMDASFKDGNLGADAEWAVNLSTGSAGISRTFYVEPYYTFSQEKFLVYLAADYLDDAVGQNIAVNGFLPDPYAKWEFGGGINWLPYTFTRFRVGVLFHDYMGNSAAEAAEYRNFFSLDVSGGVEF